jgi:hypothetical protein
MEHLMREFLNIAFDCNDSNSESYFSTVMPAKDAERLADNILPKIHDRLCSAIFSSDSQNAFDRRHHSHTSSTFRPLISRMAKPQ